MDNLIEFQCLSCDKTHDEKLSHILLSKSYLFCSICPSCGQVISSQTKAKQLEHYLNTHLILNNDADLRSLNIPAALTHTPSSSYKRRAAH